MIIKKAEFMISAVNPSQYPIPDGLKFLAGRSNVVNLH